MLLRVVLVRRRLAQVRYAELDNLIILNRPGINECDLKTAIAVKATWRWA